MSSPFHEGETTVQQMTGEHVQAMRLSRMVVGAVPENAARFIGQQIYCAIGWTDFNGDIWAHVLAGEPGFAEVSNEGKRLRLRFDPSVVSGGHSMPFGNLRAGQGAGVLFVEFSSRRRFRVNGIVSAANGGALTIDVREAFGNCPKYITQRHAEISGGSAGQIEVRHGKGIDELAAAWIGNADSFIVASAHPQRGVDVSYRGGKAGFVRVDGNDLWIPDYQGNSMFATLGNLAVNPRAGLVFIDFDDNRLLELTGDVTLKLGQTQPDQCAGTDSTGGTQRWWTLAVRKWSVSPINRAIAWTQGVESPFNP